MNPLRLSIHENKRKYELTFLIVTSFFVTIANNLHYYSLFLYSSDKFDKPEFTFFQLASSFTWYTLQCLLSILLLSFFNYYWIKYLTPKKPHIFRWLVIGLYNFVITVGLFWLSLYIAKITIGYPFGEKMAYSYYLWKYIYITPSSILVSYILDLIVRKRTIEINNAKLKEENLSNKLKTLQDQIQPHFLFNTFNTLSSVIRNESRDEGLLFVKDFAAFYRYILEKNDRNIVSIITELEFAGSYIRLLKKRFNESLNVDISISDEFSGYKIPPLTILLLIENALKHNEMSKSAPLNIKLYLDQDYIIVENNIQKKDTEQPSLEIGLQNLNKRYSILFNKEVVINIVNNLFVVKLPLVK